MRDNCVNKREYDDPMREIKKRALEAAIKAIDNQERMQRELKSLDGIAETCDKLEKALELACKQIADSVSKTGYCPMWLIDVCGDDYVEYYKRKAELGKYVS